MAEEQTIRMARASQQEIDRLREFFYELNLNADDYQIDECRLGLWVIQQLKELPNVERILFGYETLLANACDPSLDYLDWKPEIKLYLEQSANNH